MDARENALRILRFDRPERVVGDLPKADCSYFGVNHEPFEGDGGHDSPVGTFWHDVWGVGWQKALDGVMGYAREHPLADLSLLDKFAFPDPDDPRLCRQIYDRAEGAGARHAGGASLGEVSAREEASPAPVREPLRGADREHFLLRGSHRETLWERSYNLVGMDRLMLAFVDAPEAVRELLHRVMDFQLGMARHYAAVGIDVASLGDDLGCQRSLLFDPEILYEFFVPEYRRLCSFYRQRDLIISFHSCGHIEPILEMFMDLGVDVLNPVQATANDLDNVRRITQGRMALQGGVSTHRIMLGPPDEIRKETRTRLWQLGRDGGYFCAPDQGMPFPEEHIKAFDETLERYGVYPLSPPQE